jgi:hypothetical protein
VRKAGPFPPLGINPWGVALNGEAAQSDTVRPHAFC